MDARLEKRRAELRAINLAEGLVVDLKASVIRAEQHGQSESRLEQRLLVVLQLLLALKGT